MRDEYLFKCGKRQNIFPWQIVRWSEQRGEILKELHDENKYQGLKAMYNQVSQWY